MSPEFLVHLTACLIIVVQLHLCFKNVVKSATAHDMTLLFCFPFHYYKTKIVEVQYVDQNMFIF